MSIQIGRNTRSTPRVRWALPLLLSLAALTAGPAVGRAQETAADPADQRGPYSRHPEAEKAIAQIKSPYCPGFMLEVCSSAGGAALRDSIEALADQGWAADSIVDWVLANHGDQYLGLPRREGKALVAWVVPPLAILIGFGMVILALRKMREGRPEPPPARDVSPEEEAQLREAIRELEAEEDVPFI